jgi:integrase
LKEDGRDCWLNLDTANKAEAARKARDLWVKVRANGLDAVLADLRPDVRPERVCSVAEYVAAAKKLSTVRPATLAEYEASLRRVVAGVRGIVAKSDKHADRAAWRAKVDAVRLDQITPSDVRAWQKRKLDAARAEGGETAKDRRAHTLASHLRDARALFSEALVTEIGKSLALPSPLPLEGIAATATTRRFVCDLEPRKLYAAADALDADTRTAFDLLLCAGLRRGEADALPWAHVDFKAGTVTIDVTPSFRPKSRESYRTVPLPLDVLARLKKRRAAAPTAELVLEGRATKPARKPAGTTRPSYEYRAKAWPTLTAWLKKQGIRDLTPLHALRKLSGSFIYAVAGLEAARQHLGHRDVSTTARSYVAARSAVVDLSDPTAHPSAKK